MRKVPTDKVFFLVCSVMLLCTAEEDVYPRRALDRFSLPPSVALDLRGGKRSGRLRRRETKPTVATGEVRKAISDAGPMTTEVRHTSSKKDSGVQGARMFMSSTTVIANMMADLCSRGMLPIASAMAVSGGTGPVLSVLTLCVFGVLSWYSLISYARAANAVIAESGKRDVGISLSTVWRRVVPNGRSTSYIPDLCCIFLTVGCLLVCSAFLGDLFGSILSQNGLPVVSRRRSAALMLVHVIVILPLCLAKSLSALKHYNMAGFVGVFYTMCFVGKRFVDKTYAPGGEYFKLMPPKLQPAAQLRPPRLTDSRGTWGFVSDLPPFHASKGFLQLMSMCSVAYACHYNAVTFFVESKESTIQNLKSAMGVGIGGTTLVFLCMMILGYATFGRHTQASLLHNYHDQDTMAVVARACMGLAIVSGYAVIFFGFKSSLFSLMDLDRRDVYKRETKQNSMIGLCLALLSIGACYMTQHDLTAAVGVIGSLFGSLVVYVLPAIVNNSLLKTKDTKGRHLAEPFFGGEQLFNKVIMGFGVALAVLGTWSSLPNKS